MDGLFLSGQSADEVRVAVFTVSPNGQALVQPILTADAIIRERANAARKITVRGIETCCHAGDFWCKLSLHIVCPACFLSFLSLSSAYCRSVSPIQPSQ